MSIALSVVMPCHNRREALRLALESLCRQTLAASDFEVIVVDQASTDGSRDLACSLATPYCLRLLEQGGKYGISVARNAGFEAACGPLVLVLDADHVADPGVVEAHAAYQARHGTGLVYGRVQSFPPAYRSFVERAADPEGGLDMGREERLLPFYQAFGNHVSLSVNIFHRVGSFDPELKGFEDIDFAYRAQSLGYSLRLCPKAISYHNHPRTPQERFAQARSYNRMIPILLERYPELHGRIPLLQDYEPVRWGQDGTGLLWRKLRARAYGLPPIQSLFFWALTQLDRRQTGRRLAKILFWRLHVGQSYLGFREGWHGNRRAREGSAVPR